MSLVQVAEIVGVSTSTVSRVLNNHPRVAPGTVVAVRKAMEQVDFRPRRHSKRTHAAASGTGVLFLVLGRSENSTVPAFEQLLRGVSGAAEEQGLNLSTRFVSRIDELPARDLSGRFSGVLLHGDQPTSHLRARFASVPAVWLMANRIRPGWGDQVMPDSAAIGELAADYLLRRGHEHLAFVSLDWGAWSLDVRAHAFGRAVSVAGKSVAMVHPSAEVGRQWPHDPSVARSIAADLLAREPRPTGVLVPEDCQVVPLVGALHSQGKATGGSDALDFVSCNNERPYLLGLNPPPATIDIRAEAIGRRAVEQLAIRMRGDAGPDRVRTMIEPCLVEAVAPGA